MHPFNFRFDKKNRNCRTLMNPPTIMDRFNFRLTLWAHEFFFCNANSSKASVIDCWIVVCASDSKYFSYNFPCGASSLCGTLETLHLFSVFAKGGGAHLQVQSFVSINCVWKPPYVCIAQVYEVKWWSEDNVQHLSSDFAVIFSNWHWIPHWIW